MYKLIAFLTLISMTFASEAQIEREIKLKSNLKEVTTWIDAHKADIRKASGTKVLQEQNGKFKLQMITKKGTFVWIAKETVEKNANSTVYKTVLIKSIDGGLISSESTMTITPHKSGVLVNLQSIAKVDRDDIRNGEMKIDLLSHTNRVKELLEDKLR